MARMKMLRVDKAEIARGHRERFLEKVREGEMTADEFLLKICGVPVHRLQEMRTLAGL
jgi:hypothetical protein